MPPRCGYRFVSKNMRVTVKVRASAKKISVEKLDDGSFKVAVTAPPVDGKANRAVCEALADYYNVPISRVMIVAGLTGRQKIIDIEGL